VGYGYSPRPIGILVGAHLGASAFGVPWSLHMSANHPGPADEIDVPSKTALWITLAFGAGFLQGKSLYHF